MAMITVTAAGDWYATVMGGKQKKRPGRQPFPILLLLLKETPRQSQSNTPPAAHDLVNFKIMMLRRLPCGGDCRGLM